MRKRVRGWESAEYVVSTRMKVGLRNSVDVCLLHKAFKLVHAEPVSTKGSTA
jgi:hypothetical protein